VGGLRDVEVLGEDGGEEGEEGLFVGCLRVVGFYVC
jgi:hypothetical protein